MLDNADTGKVGPLGHPTMRSSGTAPDSSGTTTNPDPPITTIVVVDEVGEVVVASVVAVAIDVLVDEVTPSDPAGSPQAMMKRARIANAATRLMALSVPTVGELRGGWRAVPSATVR